MSDGERIDIGWDRPVSVRELAGLMGDSAGKTIKVRAIPPVVVRGAGALVGRFKPIFKDMAAMFAWFDTGRYVADPRRQEQVFGPAPTAEQAVARITDELATTSHR